MISLSLAFLGMGNFGDFLMLFLKVLFNFSYENNFLNKIAIRKGQFKDNETVQNSKY